MPKYLVSYDYQGTRWCEEITADSLDEADERLRCMSSGRVDGEVKTKIMLPTRYIRCVAWFLAAVVIGALVYEVVR